MKNIVELIEEQIYSQWHKKSVFTHIDALFMQKSIKHRNNQFFITKSNNGKLY